MRRLIILCCLACSFSTLAAADKPNILFLFTDDQAYDTLGVYGNPDVKTPRIDSLGERGVVFDRHYNTTAICMASRANVMLGMYEYRTGCNFDHGPTGATQWATSYPRLLKAAGYRVGFGGKFGFAVEGIPGQSAKASKVEGEAVKDEFDFWVGGPGQTNYETKKNPALARYADEYPHSTRAYGAATIDFMRESVKAGKPFCMSVFFKAPHRPVQPDPMFDDVYADTVFRKLPNYGRQAGEHFSEHHKFGRQYPRFVEWGYSEPDTYQAALRKYNQLIKGVDASVGMMLDEIDKLGIDKNTVIIFSSDNGYFNGSHGLGSKVLPYEEGARVPLIIYDPRHPQSGKLRRSAALTGNVDIAATIVALAGLDVPDTYDGRSLLPLLDNPNAAVRDTLPIVQVWGPEPTRCLTVLDGRYKYIYWYYTDAKLGLAPTEELYDLHNDPFEMHNVVKDPKQANALDKMRQLYDTQVQHWRDKTVPDHGYPQYGTLFDRHIDWDKKAATLK
ncbi:MAG: sulfatase-like hydrolase/transferase [Phycisphaera sp.]|nr:sulfatase-like hydrolase/transferase [Phycisphaera sp.]